MRYRLRTLLIVLGLGPIVLAAAWPIIKPWVNPATGRRAPLNEVFAPMTSVMDLDGIPIYAGNSNLTDVDRPTDNRL